MSELTNVDSGMSSIVASREHVTKRQEAQEEKQRMLANLIPAYELFKDVISKEIAEQSNIDTFMQSRNEANPNGDVIWQEFKARILYKQKLKSLLVKLEQAAAIGGANE